MVGDGGWTISTFLLAVLSVLVLAAILVGILGAVITVLRNLTGAGLLMGPGLVVLGLVTKEFRLCVIGALVALCCIPVWMLVRPPAKK